MDTLQKNQTIYVLLPDNTIEKARILDICKEKGIAGDKNLNPKYYMHIVARYADTSHGHAVNFYPTDMDKIVFKSQAAANTKQRNKEDKNR